MGWRATAGGRVRGSWPDRRPRTVTALVPIPVVPYCDRPVVVVVSRRWDATFPRARGAGVTGESAPAGCARLAEADWMAARLRKVWATLSVAAVALVVTAAPALAQAVPDPAPDPSMPGRVDRCLDPRVAEVGSPCCRGRRDPRRRDRRRGRPLRQQLRGGQRRSQVGAGWPGSGGAGRCRPRLRDRRLQRGRE